MDRDGPPTDTADEAEARREFIKRVGTAATIAPAVTLLLSAQARKALAGPVTYGDDVTGS